MLQPKKVKYRKQHRDRSHLEGKTKGGALIAFGSFALKAVTASDLTSRQIEAARKSITNSLKREGRLWIKAFPHKNLTRKAAEVPMGSGKGTPDHFVMPVCPGRIIFELEGISEDRARAAFRLAAFKLPFKCKFVTKQFV
ncbi:50S ribosomal protein L16 [Candidatus Peregrinibacteria bacterium]|nr:MAG: 50S ribosomal protein L16 [Candidatus Peregrinibacteria bacterium]